MSIHDMEGIRLPEPSTGDRATQVGSSHHFTGQIVLGDGPGRVVGLESHLEMKAALILAARRSTDALFEQIAFAWRDADEARRTHYIDLVVRRTDGRWIGYAVRPMKRVTPAYLAELARIKAQALEAGFLSDLRLFSEHDVDPVALFNAKLLQAVRVPDPEPDAAARAAAARITGVTTVGALVDETGRGGAGFRAVVRLIRSGHLTPVRQTRIDRDTEVFKARACTPPSDVADPTPDAGPAPGAVAPARPSVEAR
jgi:hypothetical protein